jgi:hypothetical protein
MENTPPDTNMETAYDVSDFAKNTRDKSCDVLKCGTDYARENPLLVVLGAFLIGAAVGALVVRQGREEETDRLHAAVDWLEDKYSQLADKIPKKSFFTCNTPGFLEQAQDMGKKLKWW